MAVGAPLSSSTALAVQDPYSMTPQEFSRYEQIFPSYAQADPNDGKMYVGGGAAVELFSKSGTYVFALFLVFFHVLCVLLGYGVCVCVEALKEETKRVDRTRWGQNQLWWTPHIWTRSIQK